MLKGETYVNVLLISATVEVDVGVRQGQFAIFDVAWDDSIATFVTRKWPVVESVNRRRGYNRNPSVA